MTAQERVMERMERKDEYRVGVIENRINSHICILKVFKNDLIFKTMGYM